MTTHGKDIVLKLRAALADKLGKRRFELWFGSSTRLACSDRGLTIVGGEKFFLDWIRSNFRAQIEAACVEVFGTCPAMEFVVDPQLAEHAGDADNADGAGRSERSSGRPHIVARSDKPNGESMSVLKGQSRERHDSHANGAAVVSIGGPTAGQTEGLPRRRFACLTSFVAGQANRLALASAEMAARRPTQLTPLLFYGPTGVGKTHLLEGIWTAARRGAQRLNTVYLSAEQFTTFFLDALRGSGLPNFRRKYRGVDLLLIDDLQFFARARTTQIELLHTIDTLMREGRQLVFAADRPPAELAEFGPELTTRLQSGMVCPVSPPDLEARRGIVAALAQRMGLQLPADVAEFVALRLTSHVRELSGALCRLQATAEAHHQAIGLPMAEEALADLIRQGGKAVRLPDIERAVCDVFGLGPSSLQTDTKGQSVSHPRMLAMWLARKHTRAALSEIGHFFGRRSHSTVVSAQKRVDRWMSGHETLRLAHAAVSADEAIRQVERRLAAG